MNVSLSNQSTAAFFFFFLTPRQYVLSSNIKKKIKIKQRVSLPSNETWQLWQSWGSMNFQYRQYWKLENFIFLNCLFSSVQLFVFNFWFTGVCTAQKQAVSLMAATESKTLFSQFTLRSVWNVECNEMQCWIFPYVNFYVTRLLIGDFFTPFFPFTN